MNTKPTLTPPLSDRFVVVSSDTDEPDTLCIVRVDTVYELFLDAQQCFDVVPNEYCYDSGNIDFVLLESVVSAPGNCVEYAYEVWNKENVFGSYDFIGRMRYHYKNINHLPTIIMDASALQFLSIDDCLILLVAKMAKLENVVASVSGWVDDIEERLTPIYVLERPQ